jgi:hypothetical protein
MVASVCCGTTCEKSQYVFSRLFADASLFFHGRQMKSLLSPQHVYVRNLEYVACFDMVTYCDEACEQYLAVGLDYGFKVHIID